MNFFKLPTPFWKLPDDQFVRTIQRVNRHYSVVIRIALLLWVLVALGCGILLPNIMDVVLDQLLPEQRKMVGSALVVAALLGFIFGWILITGVYLSYKSWIHFKEVQKWLSIWDRKEALEKKLSDQASKSPPDHSPQSGPDIAPQPAAS